MGVPGLAQLRFDAKSGIQSGDRTLRDQADQPSANRAELRFPQGHQILGQERRPAANPRAGMFQETQDRERQSGLPRSALTHETDNLTGQNTNIDAPQHAGLPRVIHRKLGRENRRIQITSSSLARPRRATGSRYSSTDGAAAATAKRHSRTEKRQQEHRDEPNI